MILTKKLVDGYIKRAKLVAKTPIEKAGVRLAAKINKSIK